MANEIKKIDAYHSLKPDVDTYGYENDPTWPEGAGTPPTDSEINAEVTRLQAEYDAKKYQIDRQPLYPSLGDFADAMYWNSKGDSTKLEAYYTACEKVKTDNPKPS